jgi:hypothetical protein
MPVYDIFMYLRLIFPFGDGNPAVGDVTPAFGDAIPAVGDARTAFGNSIPAGGNAIPAFGNGATALGDHVPAFGDERTAFGDAVPERPKRQKTAFGTPKMAVFEGNGGKMACRAVAPSEGGGKGGVLEGKRGGGLQDNGTTGRQD